jgi:hypothetical protein
MNLSEKQAKQSGRHAKREAEREAHCMVESGVQLARRGAVPWSRGGPSLESTPTRISQALAREQQGVNHLRIDCRVHLRLCEGSGDGRRTKQEKQPQPAAVCGNDMAQAQLGRKLVVLHQDHSESAMVGRHCWASSELHRFH